MNPSYSPWGAVQSSKTLAPGIVQVSTAGHGGILLSPDRYAKMPECFRKTWAGGAAYEEDCDWAKVAVVFPEAFSANNVAAAFRQLKSTVADEPASLAYLDACPGKPIAEAELARTANMWRVGGCGSAPAGVKGWTVCVYHNTTGAMQRGVMADLPAKADLTDAELALLWTVPPLSPS